MSPKKIFKEVIMGYENNGKHPNSLAQLRPVIDSDTAREMQAKGAEKRGKIKRSEKL